MFPYVQAPNKTAKVITELRDRGRPEKINRNWLEGAGFRSSADRAFPALLKFLNVIDNSGAPTSGYDRLKQPDWQAQLASMIKAAYSSIFTAMPDAHARSREELKNQFRADESGVSLQVIDRMVATFQQLVGTADFSHALEEQDPEDQETSEGTSAQDTIREAKQGGGVTMNINISLDLPATEKAEVYDSLFKSMAAHLRGLVSPE